MTQLRATQKLNYKKKQLSLQAAPVQIPKTALLMLDVMLDRFAPLALRLRLSEGRERPDKISIVGIAVLVFF